MGETGAGLVGMRVARPDAVTLGVRWVVGALTALCDPS